MIFIHTVNSEKMEGKEMTGKWLKKDGVCGIITVEVYKDGKIFNGYAHAQHRLS